jgi:hypothetical protein
VTSLDRLVAPAASEFRPEHAPSRGRAQVCKAASRAGHPDEELAALKPNVCGLREVGHAALLASRIRHGLATIGITLFDCEDEG